MFRSSHLSGCCCHPDYLCQLVTHKSDEHELTSILMYNNVNKLQNVDACLLILASKCLLIQVGMQYKSNQVAYMYNQDDNSMECFEQKISKIIIIQL